MKEIKNFYELITNELFENTNTKLDVLDGFILEIAFNILLAGNESFTINQIAEVLTDGNFNRDLLNKIENSLDKLSHTRIKLNVCYEYGDLTIEGIENHLLPCTIEIYSGKKENLYKFKPEDSIYLKWLITEKKLKIKGFQNYDIEKMDLKKEFEGIEGLVDYDDELMKGE